MRRHQPCGITSPSVLRAALMRLPGKRHIERLRPGERALVACLAVDRDQAKIVLNYCRAFFSDIELFKDMVTRETSYGFELANNVDISVATNSFRSVRGRPVLCGIFDEIA